MMGAGGACRVAGGPSHNIEQKFGKAFDITFSRATVGQPLGPSWGMTTRLIGAAIRCTRRQRPGTAPRLAPFQVVIVLYRPRQLAGRDGAAESA